MSNKVPITTLLAAIPYLLLSMSQSVTFTTVVESDGSGLRQFRASYQPGRQDDVLRRIEEASPDYAVARRDDSGGQTFLIRNWRWPHRTGPQAERDFSLQITDVAQQPLSPFTYYYWSEQVDIYQEAATEVEKEGKEKAVVRYILQMPGTILPQTVSSGGRIENGRAVWELTSDPQELPLKATSRQVRWGYLAIIIYILGFIIFQVVSFMEQRIKHRPRRI